MQSSCITETLYSLKRRATLISLPSIQMHICIPEGVLKITVSGLCSQRFRLSWSGCGLPGDSPEGAVRVRSLCASQAPLLPSLSSSSVHFISYRTLCSSCTGFLSVPRTHPAQPVPTTGTLLLLFPLPRHPFLTCSAGEFLPAQGSPSLWSPPPCPPSLLFWELTPS